MEVDRAGRVRVERGVRHAMDPNLTEHALRLDSRMVVCARGIMLPNPKGKIQSCCPSGEKNDSSSMTEIGAVRSDVERQQRHS